MAKPHCCYWTLLSPSATSAGLITYQPFITWWDTQSKSKWVKRANFSCLHLRIYCRYSRKWSSGCKKVITKTWGGCGAYTCDPIKCAQNTSHYSAAKERALATHFRQRQCQKTISSLAFAWWSGNSRTAGGGGDNCEKVAILPAWFSVLSGYLCWCSRQLFPDNLAAGTFCRKWQESSSSLLNMSNLCDLQQCLPRNFVSSDKVYLSHLMMLASQADSAFWWKVAQCGNLCTGRTGCLWCRSRFWPGPSQAPSTIGKEISRRKPLAAQNNIVVSDSEEEVGNWMLQSPFLT